jgi:hypothetical protein
MTPKRAENVFNRLMDDLKEEPSALLLAPKVNLEEYALSVRNTLGLPKDKWDAAKTRSLNELGKFLALKITARVLLVNTFDGMQQLERAIEVGKEMMNREPGKISDGDRIAAGKMMSLCATGLKELTAQAMELAEKGIDESERPKPQVAEEKKPKNRPPRYPSTLVQVAPGANVTVSDMSNATNGNKALLDV